MEKKKPVIMPMLSCSTVLIILLDHEKIMHAGTAYTLAKFWPQYWIPKEIQVVKSIAEKNALVFKKYISIPAGHTTGHRTSIQRWSEWNFIIFYMWFRLCWSHLRKKFDAIQKSYTVLFTYAITRALHLELVTDITIEYFLLSFRPFLARNGHCEVIYSENAKIFKKAEIENLYDVISKKICNFSLKKGSFEKTSLKELHRGEICMIDL